MSETDRKLSFWQRRRIIFLIVASVLLRCLVFEDIWAPFGILAFALLLEFLDHGLEKWRYGPISSFVLKILMLGILLWPLAMSAMQSMFPQTMKGMLAWSKDGDVSFGAYIEPDMPPELKTLLMEDIRSSINDQIQPLLSELHSLKERKDLPLVERQERRLSLYSEIMKIIKNEKDLKKLLNNPNFVSSMPQQPVSQSIVTYSQPVVTNTYYYEPCIIIPEVIRVKIMPLVSEARPDMCLIKAYQREHHMVFLRTLSQNR